MRGRSYRGISEIHRTAHHWCCCSAILGAGPCVATVSSSGCCCLFFCLMFSSFCWVLIILKRLCVVNKIQELTKSGFEEIKKKIMMPTKRYLEQMRSLKFSTFLIRTGHSHLACTTLVKPAFYKQQQDRVILHILHNCCFKKHVFFSLIWYR